MFDSSLSFLENIKQGQQFVLILFSIFAIVAPITIKLSKTKDEKEQTSGIWSILLALFGGAMLMFIVLAPVLETAVHANEPRAQMLYDTQYQSSTAKENCYLCGEHTDSPLSSYWGEDNIAIVDLNTFDFHRLDINRYTVDGSPITEKAGFAGTGGKRFQDETGLYFFTDYDRGYSDGHVNLSKTNKLEHEKVSSFLCSDCLTAVINSFTYDEEHWSVAILNFNTKEIRPLEECTAGFGIGDYSVRSRYDEDFHKINLLIWYAPLRYN